MNIIECSPIKPGGSASGGKKDFNRASRNSGLRLELAPDIVFIRPVLNLMLSFLKEPIPGEKIEQLRKTLTNALLLLFKCCDRSKTEERLEVKLELCGPEGGIRVKLVNHGIPLILKEHENKGLRYDPQFDLVKNITLENLGRKGQQLTLEIKTDRELQENHLNPETRAADANTLETGTEAEITIRPIELEEAAELSQLFYNIYGYRYINEFVYYPEKVREMLLAGRLYSIVASLPGKGLIGNLSLLRWNETPLVLEPCLGLVDPAVNSRGVFGKIVEKVLEEAKKKNYQYLFFDFVTNHDYSQRLLSKYKACDLAIYIGCQSSEAQAKLSTLGIGTDPDEMDRYSILYSVIPGVKHPFGKKVTLPQKLGEMLSFLLEPLNMEWIPESRFQQLPEGGEFKLELKGAQKSVSYDLLKPGEEAAKAVAADFAKRLKDGYMYASVDVPLNEQGLGRLCELFSRNGFFVSGFVPYKNSRELAFRFQAIAPAKVAFGQIKLYNENAKKLLEIIKADYERNCLI
ncbi:MAG: hypothetical protein NTX59_00720 [Elusimicrobia bacterium]|nr:hypothetical protein [Elusimicrobiota bacterium]